jgi:hypothetical protein
VWGAIWNLAAGMLATLGGAIFVYLGFFDTNPLVFYGAIIMLLSGIAWIISAIIGLRHET